MKHSPLIAWLAALLSTAVIVGAGAFFLTRPGRAVETPTTTQQTPAPTDSAPAATAAPTPTARATAEPTPTAAPTATVRPTRAPTATPRPTATPLVTPSPTPEPDGTPVPAQPTAAPTAAPTATPAPAPGSFIKDLTRYQWEHTNNDQTLPKGVSFQNGFQINSPNWNQPNTENAVGVVAVLDTGADLANPDLDDVLLSNADRYNPAGGANGYNPLETDVTKMFDTFGHGTHVSGIIAAEWNGFGTSGVANGVKILPVRICDTQGLDTLANVRKAYQYLSAAVDNGLNLVAINNSWGDQELYGELDDLVTQLGEKGVISVFSSGNASRDTDQTPRLAAGLKGNPYAIVVNSSARDGTPSAMSNWGDGTTDLYAPGQDILSTMSKDGVQISGQPLYQADFDKNAQPPASVQAILEGKTLLNNGAPSGTGTALSPTEQQIDFDGDGKIFKLSGSDIIQQDVTTITLAGASQEIDTLNVYLKIPVEGLSESPQLSFRYYATSTLFYGDFPIMLVVSGAAKGNDGTWSWAPARAIDKSPIFVKGSCWGTYSCPLSSFTVVDGSIYLRLQFLLVPLESEFTLYLDCLGYGEEQNTACYGINSGTSMAAPMVTGAAAVVAKAQGLPAGTDRDMTRTDYAELARERVRILKGCTTQSEALAHCTSGGMLDLSLLGDTAQYTPVVECANVSESGDSIIITGAWFGTDKGTVTLNDIDVTPVAPDTWHANSITVPIPSGLTSGLVTVRVTGSNGKTGQNVLELELPGQTDTPLFESSHELPAAWNKQSMPGPMVELNGKLYLFPQDQTNLRWNTADTAGDAACAYQDLWCYDPVNNGWSPCASLPQSMTYVSAAADGDSLMVCATNDDGVSLLRYHPASDTWEPLTPASKLPENASLVRMNGKILVVGKDNTGSVPSNALSVRQWDSDQVTLVSLAPLPDGSTFPTEKLQLLAIGNTLYLAPDNVEIFSETGSQTPCLYKIEFADGVISAETASSTDLTGTLPAGTTTFAMVALNGKLTLVGVNQVAEYSTKPITESADCWQINDTGFTAFGRQVSRAPLQYPSAAVCGNRLYVTGSCAWESGRMRLRSTVLSSQ